MPALVHEVRNYLSLARAQAQVIAMGLSADPRQDAARILTTIDRLDSTLQRFKRLHWPFPLEPRPCQPSALLQEVSALFSGVSQQRGIQVVVDTPSSGEGEPILADPDALREVLINLVQNAVEATATSGTVRLWQTADAEGVTLCVQDQGSGIDPEVARRIFDPFYSTKQRGTGLGLAICHHIVAGHGGRIWFESVPGKGSTFYMWLPRDRQAPTAPTPSQRTA